MEKFKTIEATAELTSIIYPYDKKYEVLEIYIKPKDEMIIYNLKLLSKIISYRDHQFADLN